ncbi:precorrin-6y C5,15-methyltransferase (decarboxylating) subunit CbiE [Pleurocapsa sp. PCC 7319]|uniref:precorrin-6y C5,15-methyltransferase (decarboxylating) subunit CbiE n=1 Tax=Pleurocapsa sp. PCC 7319 TaxID=118161 RepID=UPI00034CA4CB|nr:precorrin-6y C5,15-methyltransferase (decarboxylating) subunit CbiE [Pleurocapsa sp. PCC 7319]
MVIAVVGIGLDGAEGLTASARKIVEQATVLAGSDRHLDYFSDHPAAKIALSNFKTGIDRIARLADANHSIVILASGDPLFFGLGRLLLANFPAAEIQFYPHFSSVQLAFSRLKIPWQDVHLCSAHGRSTDELVKLLKQGQAKIAVLTDSLNHPAAIARLLLALDLPVSYSFNICENLGDSTEQISHFPPEQVPQLSNLDRDNFAALNVLVLLRQEQTNHLELNNLPLIGIPDSSFLSFSDRPSLITKKEIRLAILGELSLQSNQTVWDIGAGTGSVSIEMARLCPSSQILAIEKTSMGSTLITQNCQRFEVNNITNIYGKAPEALINLPHPDRIFIGGSGGNLVDILNVCEQKLVDQGVIVMSFATIEHSYQALGWLTSNSWQYRLLQLQIARSTPVQHLTRFTPLNPVTIITATRNNSQ